jgi:hypothetical protein
MIGPKVDKPTTRQEQESYELVELRDAGVCQKCRRPAASINRDHRKDRSVGGLTLVENLQMLCGSGTTGCHGWKTAHPDEANREGWGVPGWANPADYPARRWVRTAVGTVRLAQVLYLPAAEWGDGPGWVEIGEMEAATRRAGLWNPEGDA